MDRKQDWYAARQYSEEQLALGKQVLEAVRAGSSVSQAVRGHPLAAGGFIAKHVLVHVLRELESSGEWEPNAELLRRVAMKPMRTQSGVTTVTVLTGPQPCPGECIFCPEIARMPKSYLPDEPGAARAVFHEFDPYDQVRSRIEALEAIGHPTDKIELLILGGTWSAYPRAYQDNFIQRCLEAMNGEQASSLPAAQAANEDSLHRNVGLAIETRPDAVSLREIAHLRQLGVTKVQIGAQSLDDRLLELNRRGHNVADLRQATRRLRAAGFKIVLHWMPNLLGATLASDAEDFARLWSDTDLRPDELKIYPCQLLENTELYRAWERGEYQPYTTAELVELIAGLKTSIPRYCRVNRVIRDIPSTNVVAGNKRTSLRMDIHAYMSERGMRCQCMRCREVGGRQVEAQALELRQEGYQAGGAQEILLSYDTEEDWLAGFLRLSLPSAEAEDSGLNEIQGAALIREVHVYGQSLAVGEAMEGAAQHGGLGSRLMAQAEIIARQAGYARLAVIAALGTRGYYRNLGYRLEGTYMLKTLSD